ncbi:hypothetical protein QQS21_005481 [Conoideocrella luteorostrata]|uniref:DUF7924 domain-containing protein n=1 Tax=Conoideocrella luteorostrata TaxID=1105319 RepID=A0AAJ0FZ41_9HYPO|nr:hypothetical protein QQS21_005481 [Conoideocrella luteorostrata]
MAHTRAQSAAQQGRVSPAPKNQGDQPRGIRKPLKSARPRKRQTLDQEPDSPQKRPRQSSPYPFVPQSPENPSDSQDNGASFNPIQYWAREGQWPRQYFEPGLEYLRARKKSAPSLGRKRSSSATSSTPSDQRPREEKSAPYRDPCYETLLGTKGSFMGTSRLGITSASKALSATLLQTQQAIPMDSLFHDDRFEATCQKIQNKNEARVIQDISRLLVPSAESLATRGAEHFDVLVESVNEGWNNSVPVTSTRPQPDYSVGFAREAFSQDQLARLSPFIGDFISGDQSYFMATYYMYFPFLTCEVKCGAAALDVADRQNAHSMTLAVRAVTELFSAAKREDEVNRQILAFSISHNYSLVRIYGHYPVIDGKDTKYYRHLICTFDLRDLGGKEKWTTYRFTKNVYDLWMPSHFARICSAIDQLPLNLNFDDPSLPLTGLSQDLQSHHIALSDADGTSLSTEGGGQAGHIKNENVTPSTSHTSPVTAKKLKGEK